MKRLYVFIIILSVYFNGFSQYSSIQVELVDNTVGVTDGGCHSCGVSVSNDDGLNQIFDSYNIYGYDYMEPNAYFGVNGSGYFYLISCASQDVDQLLLDLEDHDTVIKYAAEETVNGKCVNVLNLSLVNESVGVQTDTTAQGFVVTNDSGLNQIFEDFNVRTYVLFPGSSVLANYSLICDCDAQLLKNELNNYSSVVNSVSDVDYSMLLSLEEEIDMIIDVFPNPFKDKLSIEVNKPIDYIFLYDILGKSIYESSSKSDFENFSSTLKSGVYLLKLMTRNGESLTKKLIKS